MQSQSFIDEGLRKINQTNAKLDALQSRLYNYVNRPKDTKRTKSSYVDLMIPNIKFNFESVINLKSPSIRVERKISQTNELVQNKQLGMEQCNDDKDSINDYRMRLNSEKQKKLTRLQEFYENRNRLLEQRIQQMQGKRQRLRRQKQLLRKQNNRLINLIGDQKENLMNMINIKNLDNLSNQQKNKKQIQSKIINLKNQLQKQIQKQSNLKTQKNSYQHSLKLFLQTHKNMIAIDLKKSQKNQNQNKPKSNKSKIQTSSLSRKTIHKTIQR